MATQPIIERHIHTSDAGDSSAVSMIVMLVALIAIIGFILFALGAFPFNTATVNPDADDVNIQLEGTLPGNVNTDAMEE